MFVCGGCEQQYPDSELKYTSIHQGRVGHPNAHIFLRRFHSRECLEMFLRRLERHGGSYIITDLTGAEPRQYGPASPAELRQQIFGQAQAAARR